MWKISTKENIITFGYRGTPGAIAFSPDGKILAAANTDRFGGTDGTITLWDAPTGRHIATLQGHTERIPAVAFSPDGATLATALRDGTIKLWAVKTGKHTAILRGRGGWSIAYSPDGTTLASGLANGTVALSKVETGRRFAILRGHSKRVTSVAFSPDSTKLAVGSANFDNPSHGVIKLWEIPPKAWAVLTGQSSKHLMSIQRESILLRFRPIVVHSLRGSRWSQTVGGFDGARTAPHYKNPLPVLSHSPPMGQSLLQAQEMGLSYGMFRQEKRSPHFHRLIKLHPFPLCFRQTIRRSP